MKNILFWVILILVNLSFSQVKADIKSSLEAIEKDSIGESIVQAAEKYLGVEYVFGGRMGRCCCRKKSCLKGIDCQSLIFFAFEEVFKTKWTKFSTMPSVNIKRKEFGNPVKGLNGVLKNEIDVKKLKKGDVVFWLLKDYNQGVDKPLLIKGEDQYNVWHTGIVHGRKNGKIRVIHAKPGHKVVIEYLEEVDFEGIYVIRPVMK